MPPSLRRLLSQPELMLKLLTPADSLPDGGLDVSVQWVHNSDLADPTPFLSAGQMLLTTGTQFNVHTDGDSGDASKGFYDDYVARLRDLGIAALGFGTEVFRVGTPEFLVAAGRAHGLPIFEVPYRTPFIAIARLAADLAVEESYARSIWALGAQRAISLAALRPDGLSATLSELSKQLDHWVALFDAGGKLNRVYPPDALNGAMLDIVRSEAARLLRRRQRASSAVVSGGESLSLQTLGRGDELRGVLALGGSAALDKTGQDVVNAVVAMAGLSLEQNRALDRARGHLRSGLMHALLGGSIELATHISREMWGPLPAEPVRVAVTDASTEQLDVITDYLELRVEEQPGALFYAVHDGCLLLVLADSAVGALGELCGEFELRAGRSDPSRYDALPRALSQADYALERAREGAGGIVDFDTVAQQGVLAFLARTDVREIAFAILNPVSAHDTAEGTELLASVRVWLEHNARFDSAAQSLGVHRHTLRARVQQAERLLGRDLSTFQARADIWAALLATG
jgi:purine catabolism regulator